MPFLVEDGTGLINANSYAAVAEFDAYCLERGIDLTEFADDTEKQQCLVTATDYIDLSFKFKGYKKTQEQALEWPRVSCYDCNGHLVDNESVPTDIKNATIEYAVRSQSVPLFNVPASSGASTVLKRQKVGPLEREFEYIGGSSSSSNKYPPGDNYLTCYTLAGGSTYSYR